MDQRPDGYLAVRDVYLLSRLRLLAAVLAMVAIASCSANGVALPAWPTPSGGGPSLCPAALHTPFTLVGDSAKSPPVWGIDATGNTFAILWPPGFTAVFFPELEVRDRSGHVVARDGTVSDAGGGGDGSTFDVCSTDGRTYTL